MPDMSTSSTSGSAPSRHSRHSQRTVPTLVLLSLAVLHSQVYWLYSVIYHLYSNISDQPQDHSLDGTAHSALSRRSGRARAFSEPQQSTSSVSIAPPQAMGSKTSPRNRPRSATMPIAHSDKHYIHPLEARLLQTAILDERLGRTRAPRWWQRTKRHLIRQDDTDTVDELDFFDALTSTVSSMDSDKRRTNQKSSIHSPRSVSPSTPRMSSCDDDDITASEPLIKDSASSSIDSLSAHLTMHQPPQHRRSLAKLRSVFIKSQIEPEPKRKTILGIRKTTHIDPSSSSASPTVPKKRLFASLPPWKPTK
ncbi:hypothetical protein [Absidia glauca]|uniref:Uncharacterized protein n=1 Tax=Absidia glauca TaxID=4829 RepID=A0A163KFG2_ABSGL|nr:hypothetical protein [Absidia glauca]